MVGDGGQYGPSRSVVERRGVAGSRMGVDGALGVDSGPSCSLGEQRGMDGVWMGLDGVLEGRLQPPALTWGVEGVTGSRMRGWAWMGRWGSRWMGLGLSPHALLGSGGGRYGEVDGPWVQDDPSHSVGERRGAGWC